uniref:Uncharacterized protein n=1 Tax=Peronospora matthiolae TaxID=2874970 RepID=A0AAV1UVG1_9STRA
MAALLVGIQLVNAIDDVKFDGIEPIGNIWATASENMRHALQLPLKRNDVALNVELNTDTFSSDSGDVSFGSGFYPEG